MRSLAATLRIASSPMSFACAIVRKSLRIPNPRQRFWSFHRFAPDHAPLHFACTGPMWRRMHCLVCDFGLAAVNIEGSATGRGGTPGFWAPELVPLDGSGNPVPYWTEPCSDPPPPCRSNITDKADTWMWAATMLAILDRLDRMRTQGYAQFTAALGRGDGLERLLSNCLKPQVNFSTRLTHPPCIFKLGTDEICLSFCSSFARASRLSTWNKFLPFFLVSFVVLGARLRRDETAPILMPRR